MHHVVEPTLKQRQQRLAGISLAPRSPGEVGTKLTLKNAVVVLDLLLFPKVNAVFGRL